MKVTSYIVVLFVLSFLLFEHGAFGVIMPESNPIVEEDNTYVHRNTRFVHADPFVLTSFPDMSLDQCIEECSTRARCKAVEYRNKAKYCSLHTVVSKTEKLTGFLTVPGFVGNASCGNAVCGLKEVCDTHGESCSVEEYGYPETEHPLTGNRFDVGSILFSQGNVKHVCAANGSWESFNQGTTCRDIRRLHPEIQTGAYTNQMNIEIYCDFDTDGGDWLVFQRRQDGSVDFYRNWVDYKLGFGDVNGEFWLGLENIYTILRASSPTQFYLRVDLEDWDGNTVYALYDEFDLHGETDNYRLHCQGYSGTAGDSLCLALGHSQRGHDQMFTTRDRDNDRYSPTNCAQNYFGAWWYDSCHSSNLNGLYYADEREIPYGRGVTWITWKGQRYSLKTTTMKIREAIEEETDGDESWFGYD